MAERRPPGFNVDLGFYDSAEVLSIPRKIRAAAVGVWTLCGCYSANKLTDGYVPAEALRDRGCTPVIRMALMKTQPEPLWEDAGDGAIRFTRWSKWQRTAAEIKDYRAAEAERKRLYREQKNRQREGLLQPDVDDTYGLLHADVDATWTPDDRQMDATSPGHDYPPKPPTSGKTKTSGRTSGGRPPESRDLETETETETELSTSVVTLGSAAKPSATTRGSRLPDAWMPPETVIAQMRSDHPHIDLRSEHEKFVDYWHAQPGAKGRKADWNATWRNWIRRAAEQAPARNGNHLKPSTTDARVAQLQAMKSQPNQQNRELE